MSPMLVAQPKDLDEINFESNIGGPTQGLDEINFESNVSGPTQGL